MDNRYVRIWTSGPYYKQSLMFRFYCFSMASKPKERARQSWDKNAMADAIKAVREKKMGFLKASKTYGVPKTTLIRLSKIDYQSLSDSKIIELLEEGCSQCYVSQRLNVSRSTVQRTWTRYQEKGSVQRRQGSGGKRCTQPRDDRFLVTQSLRNRKCSYIDLKKNLEVVRGAQVSLWTVRLLVADIRSRRPARAPKLLHEHRIARLRFARNCLSSTLCDWSSVLFSDEARICLNGVDRRRRVLRRPGERYTYRPVF